MSTLNKELEVNEESIDQLGYFKVTKDLMDERGFLKKGVEIPSYIKRIDGIKSINRAAKSKRGSICITTKLGFQTNGIEYNGEHYNKLKIRTSREPLGIGSTSLIMACFKERGWKKIGERSERSDAQNCHLNTIEKMIGDFYKDAKE